MPLEKTQKYALYIENNAKNVANPKCVAKFLAECDSVYLPQIS